MKKEFSTFGWIEKVEHEFTECRCIELHLGHHPLANASLSKTHQNTIFYDNNNRAVVFEQSKLIGVKTRREEDTVTFYEIDFEDTSLSWRKVQQKQKWVEVEEDNYDDGEDDDVQDDDEQDCGEEDNFKDDYEEDDDEEDCGEEDNFKDD